jgi:hypothetical protein
MRRRVPLALLLACIAGCAGPSGPPRLLEGNWARGVAACRAELFVRFEAQKVVALYDDTPTTLLKEVAYGASWPQGRAELTLTYTLPDRPGGVRGPRQRGVIVLEGLEQGRTLVRAQRFTDPETGALRAPLDPEDGALARALTLMRCDGPLMAAGLRGAGG